MPNLQKTSQKSQAEAGRPWVIVDVENKILGRVASEIANLLRGKDRPTFNPHDDCGSFVVVVNASKIKMTGKKLTNEILYHHTGYLGGLKKQTPGDLLSKNPDRLLRDTVWGMLPKNKLSRRLLTKLHIYPETEHSHQAQRPVPAKI
ncbi:MAG: 50S ribosomal protein L13 [Deltaproteobacteria bacterium]|nr:50S ribosomal protein L13 [Deltaproteobacteria bacterium]